MNTQIWGPLMWNLVHDVTVMADRYPNLHLPTIKFLDNLKFMFPCRYCRESYGEFIQQPEYQIKPPFKDWVYRIHTRVNKKLDKPNLDEMVFKKRCQVYTSFSSAHHLWDLYFILILNYTLEKKIYYQKFFQYFCLVRKYFLKRCNNKCYSRLCQYPPRAKDYTSQYNLFKWIHKHKRKVYTKVAPLSWYIRKFKPVIAATTPEEIARVCGESYRQSKLDENFHFSKNHKNLKN